MTAQTERLFEEMALMWTNRQIGREGKGNGLDRQKEEQQDRCTNRKFGFKFSCFNFDVILNIFFKNFLLDIKIMNFIQM